MATYKVLQDIEAEDKLLGPLSLRQFIYAVLVVVLGFIAFQFGKINVFFVIPWLIPMGFFGLLAAPFGVYQSSEIWLLGKIRYFIFPKKRIWDQSGVEELVTITVPKQEETHFSDQLEQAEVKSRLEALASTLDSRGWALRNAPIAATAPRVFGPENPSRLVDIGTLPQQNAVPDADALDVQERTESSVATRMDSLLVTAKSDQIQKLQSIVGNTNVGGGNDVNSEAASIIEKARREAAIGIAEEEKRFQAEQAKRALATPQVQPPQQSVPVVSLPAQTAQTQAPPMAQEQPTASMTIDHSDGKIKTVSKVEQPQAVATTPKVVEPVKKDVTTEVSTSEDGEVTLSLH